MKKHFWGASILIVVVLSGCAATDPRVASEPDHSNPVSDAVSKVLSAPRHALFGGEELDQAAAAFKQKVEETDVTALNAAIAQLNDLMETTHRGVQTVEQKISAIETAELNEVLRTVALLAESWAAAGEELHALLKDLRSFTAEIDAAAFSRTMESVHQSSQSIQSMAAKLSSTGPPLSTTVWLLNALLLVGITLGVSRILQARSAYRR